MVKFSIYRKTLMRRVFLQWNWAPQLMQTFCLMVNKQMRPKVRAKEKRSKHLIRILCALLLSVAIFIPIGKNRMQQQIPAQVGLSSRTPTFWWKSRFLLLREQSMQFLFQFDLPCSLDIRLRQELDGEFDLSERHWSQLDCCSLGDMDWDKFAG